MKGCLQSLGILTALAFIVTAVFAVFAVNLGQALTDRENMKQSLDVSGILTEAAPAFIVGALQAQAEEANLPAIEIDDTAVQTAFQELLPADWIDSQTDVVIDELYDFMETGDWSQASQMEVDIGPLITQFRGDPGQRVVLITLQSLPRCPDPQPSFNLAQGDLEIPGCVPTAVPLEEAAELVHTSIVQALNETPQLIGADIGIIQVPLLHPDQLTPQERENLETAHQAFVFSQTWLWLLWLIPAGCLFLIPIFVVRTLKEFGHWTGWPLLIAGGTALVLGILLPAIIIAQARFMLATNTGELGVGLASLAQSFVSNLVSLWLDRVYLQAGLMAGIGIVLVAVGFLAPGRSEKYDYTQKSL